MGGVKKRLSFAARLWCDVPAAASNAKAAAAWQASSTGSEKETQHASLLRARAAPRWLWLA